MSSKQSNFFFRFEPKQAKTQSVSVVFRFVSRNPKKIFPVCFSLFRTGIETIKTNRIFLKQTETKNPKNFQKTFSIRGSWKPLIFFSVQTETNRNSICCFSVCFFAKPKNFFRFVSMFRTGIETTKTNRTYGMGN